MVITESVADDTEANYLILMGDAMLVCSDEGTWHTDVPQCDIEGSSPSPMADLIDPHFSIFLPKSSILDLLTSRGHRDKCF